MEAKFAIKFYLKKTIISPFKKKNKFYNFKTLFSKFICPNINF